MIICVIIKNYLCIYVFHYSASIVNVKWEKSEDSGLVFQRPIYYGVVQENQTKVMTVVVVNVIGSVLNENLVFSILNPTNYFTIGRTSGVIRTTGIAFDRETQEYHQLIVQVSYNYDIQLKLCIFIFYCNKWTFQYLVILGSKWRFWTRK